MSDLKCLYEVFVSKKALKICYDRAFASFLFLLYLFPVLKVHIWLYYPNNPSLPKKKSFICFNERSLQMMKNAFSLIFKFLFVLKIFKFLSSLFDHEKPFWKRTSWSERLDWFQKLWRHNLVKKQLQYTYYQISHEVKATRQWNLSR